MFPVLPFKEERGRSFHAFSRHGAAHFEMSRHTVDRDDAAPLQFPLLWQGRGRGV